MQTPVIFEQDQAQRISPTPSMMTTLGLAEGEVLEHLERYGSARLRDLTRELEWSSLMVVMAVGALIRQGLVRGLRQNAEIILEPTITSNGEKAWA